MATRCRPAAACALEARRQPRQGGRSYTTRWDTTARIEALCAAFLPDYFPRTPREQVPEYGDAITIAQALVTGHTLPVTGNL